MADGGQPGSGLGRIVAAAATGALLQARFLFEPLTSDEAGGVVVARAWARTGTLYESAWMDRPQGLLVAHRVWDLIADDAWFLRVLAMIAVASCALAVAPIAGMMFGPAARVPAAWCCAVMMASPAVEGFATNAGLISSAIATAGLALALAARNGIVPTWWLGIAGATCGVALTVKQSAIDAPVVAVAAILLSAAAGRDGARTAVSRLAWFVGGASVPLIAVFAHGIADIGLSDYWHAVAGYHLAERSGLENPRLGGLLANSATAAPVLIVAVSATMLALRRRGGRRLGERGVLVLVWVLVAAVAALAGGNFHRHYFVLLVPCVSVAASWAFTIRRGDLPSWLSPRTVVVSCAVWAVPFVAWPVLAIGGPPRDNAAVAAWVREAEAAEGRELSVHAMCSSAGLYAELDRLPGYRYLWRDNVELMDRAREELVGYYTGPGRPEVVARYQDCDVEPEVTEAIASRWKEVARVGEVVILRLR